MLVLVDLEGTLSDHTDRLATLQAATENDPKNRTAWKEYYKGLPLDVPREYMVWAVREWVREGNDVIVYSTRFSNKYAHEEGWLETHGLWKHVELLQRDNSGDRNHVGPNLVSIWAGELKPTIIVDDREETRTLLKSCYPDMIVLGPEDFITRPAA